MANFGKPPAKKKKTRLGMPPLAEEASTTLDAPEHAPAPVKKETAIEAQSKPVAPKSKERSLSRSKTGRTVTFGTRVSQEFDDEFREVAFREKKKHVELLEAMLKVYKKSKR